MNKFYIIGIGPGREEYILPIARREIEKADCLIGSKRILSLFQYPDKEKVSLENNFKAVISCIRENKDKKKTVVLVSGDPGLYSFSEDIRRAFKKEEYAILPGISTLQLAFARIGENWQDAKVISIHGRGHDNLAEEVRNSDNVFLFTDSRFPPERIALHLLKNGVENRRAVIFERLTYLDERIVDTDLKNLSEMKGFELCVMIIKR